MSKAFKTRRTRGVMDGEIGAQRARHLSLAIQTVDTGEGRRAVTINEAESPLLWLARRKGRDGRPLIEPRQLLAGDRLRTDYTCANLAPRMGVDWSSPGGTSAAGHNGSTNVTEAMIASRQRLHHALDAAGPEFSGVLMDVCCFLKGLPEVEAARGWPARSGKVILQLGLDRLVRHYGLATEMRGPQRAATRAWRPD